MERGLRRCRWRRPGQRGLWVGADGPMERGLRHPFSNRPGNFGNMSAPTARWKGDCDDKKRASGKSSRMSAPTARWKGDCDAGSQRMGLSSSKVGADGPMERGLRPPPPPKPQKPPPVGADGPMERGLRRAEHVRRRNTDRCRRRRPDGKGIATIGARDRGFNRAEVGADGPMERGLRPQLLSQTREQH